MYAHTEYRPLFLMMRTKYRKRFAFFLQCLMSQKLKGMCVCMCVCVLSQAISFAAERINEERLLPRNLTLGFVVLDDCLKESATAVQSMTFVPQTSCQGNNLIYQFSFLLSSSSCHFYLLVFAYRPPWMT